MTNPAIIAAELLEFTRNDRADKALKLSGVTGKEMAEYLGVTPSTVSRYINGKAAMPLQVTRLWALRTGVPFEWLETGKAPSGDNPGEGGAVGHQGLEPRTRWLRDASSVSCSVVALPALAEKAVA